MGGAIGFEEVAAQCDAGDEDPREPRAGPGHGPWRGKIRAAPEGAAPGAAAAQTLQKLKKDFGSPFSISAIVRA